MLPSINGDVSQISSPAGLHAQDDEKKGLDEVQKLTDQYIKTIDDLQKKKDTELLPR